jgi:hypothetical protein
VRAPHILHEIQHLSICPDPIRIPALQTRFQHCTQISNLYINNINKNPIDPQSIALSRAVLRATPASRTLLQIFSLARAKNPQYTYYNT